MQKLLPSFFALLLFCIAGRAQQAIGILDINNIHCNVSATGDLFNRFDDETLPGFEVPAGSGLRTIYAGNMWVGGVSPDQQLKLAAEMFQDNGQDWFSGPLTTDGTAEISAEQQAYYNQVWVANLADVETHIAYFIAVANGQTEEAFPEGYSIPLWFFDWPAHGNVEAGQDYFLAPFTDYPGSDQGVYDPQNGDTPLFCGEQCAYFIFNDKGNVHTASQGQPIGLEIHGMLYGFNSSESDMLNNTVFLKYKIINRGTQTLTNTYVGLWNDFDLGNPTDDYVGTDVQNSAVYVYNADAIDEANINSTGYQDDLPMQGLVVFGGVMQDDDLLDNPITTDINIAINNLGVPYEDMGIGYGDGNIDNERMGLTSSIYFGNDNGITGVPSTSIHFYNYMRSFWSEGSNLVHGGIGLNDSNQIPSKYVYPGNSDPLFWATSGEPTELWTEPIAENTSGDRMMLSSCGPFTLMPGDIHYLDAAYVFSRESDDSAIDNVAQTLEQRMIEAKLFFNEFLIDCHGQSIPLALENIKPLEMISIFPNPVSDILQITIPPAINDALLLVHDMTGKLVLKFQLVGGNNQIDFSALKSGIYSACILSGTTKNVTKLIVE